MSAWSCRFKQSFSCSTSFSQSTSPWSSLGHWKSPSGTWPYKSQRAELLSLRTLRWGSYTPTRSWNSVTAFQDFCESFVAFYLCALLFLISELLCQSLFARDWTDRLKCVWILFISRSKTAKVTPDLRIYASSYLWSGGVEATGRGTKAGWSFTHVYWLSLFIELYTYFLYTFLYILYFNKNIFKTKTNVKSMWVLRA